MTKNILKLSALVLLSASLVGCGIEEYKTSTVNATVVEKEYEKAKTTYTTVTKNGKKVKKKKTKSAEYEVDIQYKGIEKEYDDKRLYDSVRVGDKVKVKYIQGFDKDGNLVFEDIERD